MNQNVLLSCELCVLPKLHINVIYVLRQRMPIITPLDTTIPVSKDVSAIGFIHPKHFVS